MSTIKKGLLLAAGLLATIFVGWWASALTGLIPDGMWTSPLIGVGLLGTCTIFTLLGLPRKPVQAAEPIAVHDPVLDSLSSMPARRRGRTPSKSRSLDIEIPDDRVVLSDMVLLEGATSKPVHSDMIWQGDSGTIPLETPSGSSPSLPVDPNIYKFMEGLPGMREMDFSEEAADEVLDLENPLEGDALLRAHLVEEYGSQAENVVGEETPEPGFVIFDPSLVPDHVMDGANSFEAPLSTPEEPSYDGQSLEDLLRAVEASI